MSSREPPQAERTPERTARAPERAEAGAPAGPLLARLQRTAGNRAVARLVAFAARGGAGSGGPQIPVRRTERRIARTIEGEVRVGDRFTVTVFTAEGEHGVGTFPVTVDPAGRITIVEMTAVVRGVRSESLDSRLATLLSNHFRFPVFVRIEYDVLEGRDRRAEREAVRQREAAQAGFEAFLRVAREPPEAVLRFRQWMSEHRDSPEFLTVTPSELWARSLRPPPVARDPMDERRDEYIRYMQALTERTATLTGAERRRHLEALERFSAWFDRHSADARALARNPGEVFGGFSVSVTVEQIDREVEAERRRRAAAPMSDAEVEARGRKFDEFLALARQLFGYSARRFPYRIPIDVEGRDILVTGDPAVQMELDLIGGMLISWAGQHLADPDFLSVNPRAVLLDILRGPAGQAYTLAQREPLESESIDRGEIVPGRALAAFGEAVATGLLVVAIVGLFVGAEIITAGQATWLLVGIAGAGGITSYLGRREEIEQQDYDVPVGETIVHSAGDVVGVSQIVEAYSGQRLGSQRRLTSLERSEAAGTGGAAVVLTLQGSRAFRTGQSRGQAWRLRQRGSTPPGPGGRTPDALPTETVPPRPQPNPTPGPNEAAARAALPEEVRVGFDRWMELIRRGGDDPEVVLGGMMRNPAAGRARIERVSRGQAESYRRQVEAGERAESVRTRMGSDPLNPALRHTERRGNITIRSENPPPPPTSSEIAQAQRLQRATGEPVTLFGDTPQGQSYPGIDGVIGRPPRPLSIKRSEGAANADYVRVHAADAYDSARTHGYSHVEVHIEMDGCTMAQVRAGWAAPRLPRGSGPVADTSGTIARIVIRASDGVFNLTPPLAGRALPGVLTPDETPPESEERRRP